jgi:hypothetical protein
MARRWARALLLIFSWGVLITGVIALAVMAAVHGSILATMRAAQPPGHPLPEAAVWTILLVTGAVMGIILLVIPAIWAFFYGSKNVKATCEARDPQERWTDRCPLPVLALSLFLGFGAVGFLMAAFAYHGAIPIFGVFISGLPGVLLYLVLACLWCYAAWAMYRLDSAGWWISTVGMCVLPISCAITYHQHSILEFYRLAGYSDPELTRLQQFSFINGNNAVWLTLASALPWLAFLFFIKKYFHKEPTTLDARNG